MDPIKVNVARPGGDEMARALVRSADMREQPGPEAPVERPAIASARQRLAAASARRAAAAAALDEERASDAAQVAELEAQALEDEREAARLEHERQGERVYRAELGRRGRDRVAIIRTKLGPIVMRPMSEAEDDALSVRQQSLEGVDVYKAAADAALETVLYPPPAKVREWIAEYAGIAATLVEVRRRLLDGVLEEARGKA